VIFRPSRLLLSALIPLLLVGGCAVGKVAVQTPTEASRISGNRPVFPASEKLPLNEPPPSAQPPQALPSPITAKEGQPSGAVAPCEEQQPLVQVERYLKLPAVSHVDRRMSLYGEKLSRWKTLAEQTVDLGLVARRPPKWSECFTAVDHLFQGYSRLLEEVLKQDLPTVREEELSVDPWQLYYDDIAYLEGGCAQVYQNTSALVAGLENRYTSAQARESEAVIGQYVEKGLYEEAILAYHNLQNANPDRELKEETRRIYGLALLKTGQMDKASRELSKALETMPPSPAKRSLRRLVADLLLASGQLDEAYANYRQLAEYYESGKGDDRWVADQLALLGLQGLKDAPELPLYLEVLQDFIRFNGHKIPEGMKDKVEKLEEVYPASPLTVRARQMFGQIEDSLREWLKGEMNQVDLYLAAHEFASAKALLELLLVDDLEPPALELAQRTMDNVVQAESQYNLDQQLLEAQRQAEKWDRAVTMLDSGKYDQAISELATLFNTEYDVPAREKIKEAMEAAATQMRRQAANLFIKARKADSYDEKKKYLEESWSLINKIITSYPQVTIIDKVKQNQALIEQQIEQFDPLLLRSLKGAAPGVGPGSGGTLPIPATDFH